MGLLDNLIAIFCAQKALESLENDTPSTKKKWYSRATYTGLRQHYYNIDEYPDSLLDELFRREPDLIDGTISSDCREYLQLEFQKYSYKGRTVYGKTCFTISTNNRFLCQDFINEFDGHHLRDYDLIDFSHCYFAPVANPVAQSITIGDYTLFFDHPFYYNVALMLLIRADNDFKEGPSIESRAINLPPVFINKEILDNFEININFNSNQGLKLYNAFYSVLSDFNTEIPTDRYNGVIVLRIVDGRKTVSDDYTPCSVIDLLDQPISAHNQFLWPSIVPSIVKSNHIYLPGLQFEFLSNAEDVIIRGDPDSLELYVCRTNDGWGGIRFKLQNKKDYYSAAVWLIPAVAMFYRNIKGIDYKETIKKYWPTFFADISFEE